MGGVTCGGGYFGQYAQIGTAPIVDVITLLAITLELLRAASASSSDGLRPAAAMTETVRVAESSADALHLWDEL